MVMLIDDFDLNEGDIELEDLSPEELRELYRQKAEQIYEKFKTALYLAAEETMKDLADSLFPKRKNNDTDNQ